MSRIMREKPGSRCDDGDCSAEDLAKFSDVSFQGRGQGHEGHELQ